MILQQELSGIMYCLFHFLDITHNTVSVFFFPESDEMEIIKRTQLRFGRVLSGQ